MPKLSLRARPGLSVLELLLVVSVTTVVALPVTALVTRSFQSRQANHDDLAIQQCAATVFAALSQDIRQATGITQSTATAFTLSHPLGPTTAEYVSYRLADGRLLRGVGQTPSAEPDWKDLVDRAQFRVAAGSFTYFAWANGSTALPKLFRRIALKDLKLAGLTSGESITLPVISAVMRESGSARSLVLSGPVEHSANDHGWHDAVHVAFSVTNASREPLTLSGFAGEWDSASANDYLDQITLDASIQSKWGNGSDRYMSAGAPVTLNNPITLAPGAKLDAKVFFKLSKEMHRFTLLFFEPDDTTRQNPITVPVTLP